VDAVKITRKHVGKRVRLRRACGSQETVGVVEAVREAPDGVIVEVREDATPLAGVVGLRPRNWRIVEVLP
jgi:hypothetical protein